MDKACPVVIRPGRQILAFRHPQAGQQLVKGGVEPTEHSAKAAERELFEESGLTLPASRDLGQSADIVPGDVWHFWLMGNAPHPDKWSHHTQDDGGHTFEFFWHPLDTPALFAAPYTRALTYISQALP